MQTHQSVTALPVDLQRDRLAGLRQGAAGRHDVQDAIGCLSLAGIGDGKAFTAGPQQCAGVARLPAALRVEHGPVELDAALAGGEYPRGGGLEIGVVPEQQLGHGCDRVGVRIEFS